MQADPIIRISGLNKTFGSGDGQVIALDNIDLEICQGEIFGVIGLSGAGKSTLVRCINLLERPSAGHVMFDGQEMTALSEKELRMARRSISMIFQGFNLLAQRTALDNVCFPLELMGVSKKDARGKAKKLLATVGLADREHAYPIQLSGGQKQRVAIARALATDPKVLLCDEATSALDPTTTLSILELLKELNASLGLTVVVITHEMKVIEKICSRVAILSESHIVEMGNVTEIFRHPKTTAARALIYPSGEVADTYTATGGKLIRLTFDGETSTRPIVSEMIMQCGAPVNIAFADTKSIGGRAYGQMILQLPDDDVIAGKMLAYLDSTGVSYEEEVEDVYS